MTKTEDSLPELIPIERAQGPVEGVDLDLPNQDRAALELVWAVAISLLPFAIDFLVRSTTSAPEHWLSISAIGFSIFALSASAMARAIYNGEKALQSVYLLVALVLQGVLSALLAEAEPQIVHWVILVVSGGFTIVGIWLTWWPNLEKEPAVG